MSSGEEWSGVETDGQVDMLARGLNRREFLRVAIVAGGALLSGCGRRGDDVPGARVTLTQWYHQYGEKGTQEAVLRYAAAYTRSHPDVAVRVVWVPGDYHTKLATALLTSGGPDIFETSLTVPMVSADQVVGLDDLFPPAIRRDFLQRDLDANSVGGKIYGVKMVDDTGILYYRPSLLKAARLKPPQTMDELISSARKLQTRERKGLFVGNDGGISALTTLMPWSAGSDFLQGDKILFNNARTALSYEKLRELSDSGALLIGATTDWWDPSVFNQGQAAMQWSGMWAFPAIRKALGDDVGGMAWPALDHDRASRPVTFLGGWSQMINSRSPHIEEAKKFVRWLWIDNLQLQQDWNLSYGFHVPPRLSVAKNATPLRAAVPSLALKNVQKHGRFTPPAWNSAMGTALGDAITNIVKNGSPAMAQIEAAAFKCERELKRLLQ